jgi:CDP-diacylglycerol--glycerol-3-phosphate 3-phosphatidyltransferase
MKNLNLPNKLTILRILAVPFIILCFYLPPSWGMWVAVVLFIAAAITDTVDGRYARAHNMVTDFGKFMDPIADKLLVNSVLVMLTAQGKVHPVATILFIAREFVISGLRLVAAGKGVVLAAGNLGKIKTTLQDIALPFLMVGHVWKVFRIVGLILLYASLVMSVWSGWDYVYKNRDLIKQE